MPSSSPRPSPTTLETNVMWVAAQVFARADPSFGVFEFAEWCGIDTRTRAVGRGNPQRPDDATGPVD